MIIKTVTVSVCLITYNHEKFIAQAIESVLAQQHDFSWEVIIADDCSTDGTRAIIEKYAAEYPELIQPILRSKNVGPAQNFMDLLAAANGDFIAYLECDDYWTDSRKLQKQVGFLQANPDFSICYHAVAELKDGKSIRSHLNKERREATYTIEDLAVRNMIHSPSVVFKNNLYKPWPKWYADAPAGDYVLHMLNARHGKIKYFPDVMAVYRVHSGGVWSTQNSVSIMRKWNEVLRLLMSHPFSESVKKILLQQQIGNMAKTIGRVIAADEVGGRNLLSEEKLAGTLSEKLWEDELLPAIEKEKKWAKLSKVERGLRKLVGRRL